MDICFDAILCTTSGNENYDTGHIDDFLIDHPIVENAGIRTFSTFFNKNRSLGLSLSILRMPLCTNMFYKRERIYKG